MPSPFPGMDPFIESQRWGGFYQRFITLLGDMLVAMLRPRYEVEPEERVYVETAEPEWPTYRTDVAISQRDVESGSQVTNTAVLDVEPTTVTLPMPIEEKEPYLMIRRAESREVVAVIELLSPTNKRTGSDGRKQYLSKRTDVLRTRAHLIEFDLLLGGQRLPMMESLKADTSYCAIVSRAGMHPRAELFEWPLKHPLPRISVPLAGGDPDAILDLQEALNTVYDRAGYDYSVHYDRPLDLPMRSEDRAWMQELIAVRASR
jgi:hypothetical protein